MLATYLNKYAGRCLLFLAIIFYLSPAFSQQITVTNVSAVTMIENMAKQLPNIMRMVTAIAYVMGLYMVFFGVLKLKQYGEQRTMMSSEHHLKGPIIYITIGTLLLYLPSSVQVGMSTFWAEPNPYGYLLETDQWGQFLNDCFMILQLIGVIAFIRGLMILSQLGGQGGHQGAFGRGLTHIVSGIFLINIYQFIQVILVTLGLQLS